MANSTQRDADRRREILDAALACFLQYGYAKTSLDDIAQRAGISRPLLYRKFKNKEDIFGACYDDVFESLAPRVKAILDGRGSKKEKLLQFCEVVCVEPSDRMRRGHVRAPAVGGHREVEAGGGDSDFTWAVAAVGVGEMTHGPAHDLLQAVGGTANLVV